MVSIEESSSNGTRMHETLAGILFGVCVGVYATALNNLICNLPSEMEIALLLFAASYIVMLGFWCTYMGTFAKLFPSTEWKQWVIDFTLPFAGFQGVLILPYNPNEWYLWFGIVYFLAACKYSSLLSLKIQHRNKNMFLTKSIKLKIYKETLTCLIYFTFYLSLKLLPTFYSLRLFFAVSAFARSFIFRLAARVKNFTVILRILSYITGYIAAAIAFTIYSAIPWMFTYLQIGRLIGPNLYIQYILLILFALSISLISLKITKKLTKRWITSALSNFIVSLLISCLVIFSFSAWYMPQVAQAGKKIDEFISNNENLEFREYINGVARFLDENVGAAYGKPEASFKLDILLINTLFDRHIMQIYGVTRADLIVYQGWGTCEQAAILIEELLFRAGYETRRAYFMNIDHQWAEVKYNGTWLIVDPWYIGILVEAQNLKNLKPQFQQASGVEVLYPKRYKG